MNTIPRHLSLVPACPYTYALSMAIAEVETRQQRNTMRGPYPYASAFLRHYCGAKSLKSDHLRRIMPEYTPGDRHSPPAREYLTALNILITSRGERCPYPLSQDTCLRLFPQTAARAAERREKRLTLRTEREQRHVCREREQKRKRYRNRLAQAASELVFHTPQNVQSWYRRWQDRELYEIDMLALVMAWFKRFVSYRHINVMDWQGEPLWRVMFEIGMMAKELTPYRLVDERFALPVLLTHNL